MTNTEPDDDLSSALTPPHAATSTPSTHTTGWEKADSVAHGAGAVVHGIGWVLTKGWGVILVLIGIVILVANPAKGWWAGLLLMAYGIYLLAPGSKFVVW